MLSLLSALGLSDEIELTEKKQRKNVAIDSGYTSSILKLVYHTSSSSNKTFLKNLLYDNLVIV